MDSEKGKNKDEYILDLLVSKLSFLFCVILLAPVPSSAILGARRGAVMALANRPYEFCCDRKTIITIASHFLMPMHFTRAVDLSYALV